MRPARVTTHEVVGVPTIHVPCNPDPIMAKKKSRDVERSYTAKQFVSKLRRLADAIENDKRFRIQVAGERVSVPSTATISVEHERDGKEEEIELQIRWINE